MELIDLLNDVYLAKFTNWDDCEAAFKGGPWMVMDYLVSVAKWQPHFDPYDLQFSKITTWVRFPGLPIEYYNFQALRSWGSLTRKLYMWTELHLVLLGVNMPNLV